MKSNFQTKLSDKQFKTMRMVMVTKDEEGSLGIKFLFSTAVFLLLCVVFFPLAIIWFIVCTSMALNERSSRATIKAAQMVTKSQEKARREDRKEAKRKELAKKTPTGYKMKPSDYYYN